MEHYSFTGNKSQAEKQQRKDDIYLKEAPNSRTSLLSAKLNTFVFHNIRIVKITYDWKKKNLSLIYLKIICVKTACKNLFLQ